MLAKLVLLFSIVGLAKSQLGGFQEGSIEDHPQASLMKFLAKESAESLLKSNTDDSLCHMSILTVDNYQRQVVEGTIHNFDLLLEWNEHCGPKSGESTKCINFNIFEALPSECEHKLECYEVINKDDIDCRITLIEPLSEVDCLGCQSAMGDIEDETDADEIKKIAAKQATEYLKEHDLWVEDEDYCGVNMLSVDNYKRQVVAGSIHEFDAILKYNKHCGDFYGKVAFCQGFRVLEHLSVNCASPTCLEPMQDAEIICEVQDLVRDLEMTTTEEPTCAGCFTSESRIEDEREADEMKALAAEAAELNLRNQILRWPLGCNMNVVKVDNYRSQVVAGIVHKFDATLKWNKNCEDLAGQVTKCNGVSILEKLSSNCENEVSCFQIIRANDIFCNSKF